MNTHYFHFINQTLSLKHFTAIGFQKAVVLHFFDKDYIIDLLMVFTNHFILSKIIMKINKHLIF